MGEKNFNSFSAHLFSVPLCKMDVKGKAILDRLITQLAVLEEQGLGHSLFFFVYNRMRFLMLGRSDKKKKNHKKSRNSSPGTPGRHSQIWINKMYNIL